MQISTMRSLDPNGILYSKDPFKELSTLCYDSREAVNDCAFFCFSGTQTNGERFIDQATKKGASLVVTENENVERVEGISYFISSLPTRTLFAKASALFFNYPSRKLTMIGITGTDGKTSTSYFTYQLLKLFDKKIGLLNTVYYSDGNTLLRNDTHMSTPESFFVNRSIAEAVNNGSSFFVLEATSHALSQEFNRLCDITYDFSAYTNISSEHLEFHKTYPRYIDAKCNLARRTKERLFIYDTNKELEKVLKSASSDKVVLTCPKIIKNDLVALTFSHNRKCYTLPFGQSYNLENAFEAANIVSSALNIELDKVLEKLQYLMPVKGRFQMIKNEIRRNIIIDFAHTPKAYQALMESTLPFKKDHAFIAVFGSSGKRDSSKRPDMGRTLSLYCDHLIITEDDNRGEDLKTIYEELTSKIDDKDKVIRCDDREKAIKTALNISSPGDFIFLLGLGPQIGIDKGSYTKDWDEEEVVKKLIKEAKR